MKQVQNSLTAALRMVAAVAAAVTLSPVSGAESGPPTLEVVAALQQRPGNVAVAADGRVFATVHPLGSPSIQLTELVAGKAVPFPSPALQKNGAAPSDDTLDTPLGIVVDQSKRLWTIDIGLSLGKTRLWAFDLGNGKTVQKIELPAAIAPKGSFVQDLAVDEKNGWVFLADIAPAGLIAVDLANGRSRRLQAAVLQSEDKDMIIDGTVIQFGGKPARVGVNPVTLSSDRETLYFGAMNGTSWYALPTRLFRDAADDASITAAVTRVGPKPISDGAASDAAGNHYFTDLQQHAISRLSKDGKLSTLLSDPRLDWPDNVAVGPKGWVYVSVNQLTTTPAFTGGEDRGKPPYYVYRFRAR